MIINQTVLVAALSVNMPYRAERRTRVQLIRTRPFEFLRRFGLAALAGMALFGQDANASVVVDVRDGLRISATVGDVSVETAVMVLGEALGAEVVVRGDLGPARQESFSDIPFEEALRRIIGRNGFMVLYQPREAPDGPDRPREIRVFPREASRGVTPAEQPVAPPPSDPKLMTADAAALVEKGDVAALGTLGRLYESTQDPTTRRQLIAQLSQRHNPAAGDLFSQALHDPEQAIRIIAARGLWASRGVDGARQIREAARRERDPTARQALEQLLKLAERRRPD
jgi:hypothetical protein